MVSHYNIQPVIDVYGDVQGRDLGAVAKSFERIVHEAEKKLPRGSSINVRGQVETMKSSFLGLGFGLLFAIALVYLLIVINFQSWSDPFIIITALPGALCGIVWMLFLTRTTLNVPSLMGAVMSIGVATANSILVVTFAKERLAETRNAFTAALDAGYIRLRPVVMTALAMIIGMVPMALGLGEGGEQNAPLGPGRDRRPAICDGRDALFCSGGFLHDPKPEVTVEPNGAMAEHGSDTNDPRIYESNGNRTQRRIARSHERRTEPNWELPAAIRPGRRRAGRRCSSWRAWAIVGRSGAGITILSALAARSVNWRATPWRT